MFDQLLQWLLRSDNHAGYNFRLGYLSGVLAVLVLLVVLKLLQILLFGDRSRSAGVIIRGEFGSLFISAQAIADLVRGICQDYPRLDLGKVILRDDGKHGLRLELNLDAESPDGNFPELTQEVQRRIMTELNERFGINAVRRVDVKLRRLLNARNRPF